MPRAKAITLTDREKHMLDLIVEGKTGEAFARAVGLKHSTVRVYLCNLYKKIGVANKTEAAVYWVKRTVRAKK